MSWTQENPSEDLSADTKSRFGGTIVEVTHGRLAEQPVRALIVSANQRGVMGAGNPGSVRALAGDRVEREAMSRSPLPMSGALTTRAGNLAERGIEAIIHAVVAPAPGHPATFDAIRRATAAALEAADSARLRSIALPAIGSGTSQGQLPFEPVAAEIVESIVAYLRRNDSRIERIVFVTDFADDRQLVERLVRLAYLHQWTKPG